MEELCELGTHTVLRVGTCGAIQPSVRKGDLIIATSAVRDEGTSRQYVPIEVPAVASFDICSALLATVRASGVRFHTGIVHSKDSFHAQTRPDSMPIASTLHERWTAMQRSGVLASEMECAAIFTVAAVRSMRAGALLLCVNEPPYEPAIEELPLNDLVTCAVHALAKVIDADKNPRPAETSSAE
jgi:uridine phosphorylase